MTKLNPKQIELLCDIFDRVAKLDISIGDYSHIYHLYKKRNSVMGKDDRVFLNKMRKIYIEKVLKK